MNDDIDNRRDGSFDKSLDGSDAEREEEEQTVKKKISSSRSNTKQDPSQKKLSDYSSKWVKCYITLIWRFITNSI